MRRNRHSMLSVVFMLLAVVGFASQASAQLIHTVAGGGPNNVPATSANLSYPTALAIDSNGNTYIAATDQNVIFKADTSGLLTVVAGNGSAGYNGDGEATNSELSDPYGLALDGQGNIYIADTVNERIRVVNMQTNPITVAGVSISPGDIGTVAGNGTQGYLDGPATSAELDSPDGLVLDGAGNIYIADMYNNRIRVVNTQAGAITVAGVSIPAGSIGTVAGTGSAGFNGDGAALSSSLEYPEGIALDGAGNIYVADTFNNRVRVVNTQTNPITVAGVSIPAGNIGTVAGTSNGGYNGDGAATSSELEIPSGVAVDVAGNIYVADTFNNRIRVVNTQTNPITVTGVTIPQGNIGTVAGNYLDGFNGDGVATSSGLDYPIGVTLDAAGNIYIADTEDSRIRVVNTQTNTITVAGVSVPSGSIGTVAGNGSYGFRDGVATNSSLSRPSGVVSDGAGNVYIADTGNSRIRVVNTQTSPITVAGVSIPSGDVGTVAGNGNGVFNGDGAATSSTVQPEGVALDGLGNIYVADTDNQRIRVVNTQAGAITVAGVSIPSGSIGTVAGNGTAGFNEDGEATSSELNYPHGVALDGLGNIYVADTDNQRIRVVNTQAGAITVAGVSIPSGSIGTVAGNGTAGFNGDGAAISSKLNYPGGVALDGAGNIYIADAYNNRIRIVNTQTNPITVTGVTIPQGNIGTVAGGGYDLDGPAANGYLSGPEGVALDGVGNIYIGDTYNNRIGVVNTQAGAITVAGVAIPSGNIGTVGGGGYGYNGDDIPATSAWLAFPMGVSLDGLGNIYVADYQNQRIREIDQQDQVNVTIASSPAGLSFSVSGTGCAPGTSFTTPMVLAWTPGSSCIVTFTTPQTSGAGTQYVFSQWEDTTTSSSRTITAPSSPTTYTATFTGPQTITFTTPAPATAAYGSSFTVAAQSSSGLMVTLSVDSSSAGICALGTPSVAGGVTSATVTMGGSAGTCTIDANQGGNGSYNAAMQVQSSATAVQPISQTITITTPAPASAGYGSTFPVAAQSSSGLPVTLSVDSTSTSVCTLGTQSTTGVVTTTTVTMTSGSGTCTIFALQPGNTMYSAAVPQQTSATAQKGSQTITIAEATPPVVTAQSTSGLTVTLTVDGASTGGCSIGAPSVTGGVTTATVTMTSAGGTCVIDANQAGNVNYNAAAQQQFSAMTVVLGNTLTVTNTNDSGYGSLRDAIDRAVSGDTINFSLTPPATIMVASTLTISTNLTISGPGASNLAISGGGAVQVFSIGRGITVNISGVTIENGNTNGNGGGISNGGTLTLTNSTVSGNSAPYAGGIYTYGTLTLTNSTVSGNSATSYGGGIYNGGTLTLTNSTVSGNSANSYGGGIYGNGGILTLTNSTVSGNSTNYEGGGIYNEGTLTLTNSTVSGNSASSYGGGGIYSYYGTQTAKNSLLANSSSGGNCASYGTNTTTSQGHNLSDDSSCTAWFNQIGDLNSTAAGLDPNGLQNNGGPTQTIALQSTSAAVDAIPLSPINYCTDTNGNAVTTDQRGIARPQGPACDIGAFELVQAGGGGQTSQTITITTPAPASAGYGSTFPVAAQSSSGLPVTLSVDSTSTSVCTLGTQSTTGVVTTTTVTMTSGSGTCTIFALQPGNTMYSAAVPQQTSATAQKGSQTITIAEATPPVVTAQSTSGLTVTLTVDGASTGGCSIGAPSVTGGVTTATVTMTSAGGTCVIDANQAGNVNYNAAAQQQFSAMTVVLGNTLTVTNTNDSGYGSLRDAIDRAVSGDTINFSLTPPATIMVASTLTISTNLTISGPGASNLAISGGGAVQVFSIGRGITVNISGVTIENGNTNGNGGGISNGGTLTLTNSTVSGNSAPYAGGIYTYGTLTLTNSTVSGNSATSYGGGIYNGGTLTLTNSTVSGNSANSYGGGIYGNGGILTLTNSTVSGNSTNYEGGGIYNEGTLTLTNSTVSGNSASSYGGGGIYSYYGTQTAKNSLLANSSSGGNCASYGTNTTTSQGHNLSDDSSCTAWFNQIGDLNSTAAGLDPNGLQNNGGPTQTIALQSTSAAVDAIPLSPINYCTDTNGNAVTTDQRGIARPQGPACDIGAFELVQAGGGGQTSQTITITTPAPASAGYGSTFPVAAQSSSGLPVTLSVDSTSTSVCTLGTQSTTGVVTTTTVTMTSGSGTCTIFALQPGNTMYSAAVPQQTSATAQKGSQTITIAEATPPVVTAQSTSGLTVTLTVDGASTGGCSIGAPSVTGGVTTATVTMTSAGGTCVIDANQAGNVNYNAAAQQQFSAMTVVLGNTLTVTNTNDSGYGSLRDAIDRAVSGDTINFSLTPPATIMVASTLTISTNLTISGPGASNLAISGGGAVQVFSIGRGITVNISGVTIENGNTNGNGGGISNGGTLTLTNSTVSGNSAPYAGGIYTYGTLTLTNSTVSGNSATSYGGGIYNGGTLTLTNSTVSGNSANSYGGGIYGNGGILTLTNSTVSGNSTNYEGGGIYNEGTLTLTNSTVSGNSASSYGGGGIYSYYGTQTAKNSLLANSSSGGNCASYGTNTTTSQGHNLSDDSSCTAWFNQIGDLNSTAAGLDPNGLQNNGGPTQTIALQSTSAAVDAIPLSPINYCTDTNGNAVTTDQRGIARPQGPACDIGAFELIEGVGETSQTITFITPAPTTAAYNSTFPVAAQSSSTLPVTLSVDSISTSVCSLGTQSTTSGVTSTTVMMLSGAGSCTIDATQLGNSSYSEAIPQQTSAAAQRISQTITFTTAVPMTATYGNTFPVAAQSTSGLTVGLSVDSTSTSVCSLGTPSLSGAVTTVTVTILSTLGTCTIDASQSGNGNYTSATQNTSTTVLVPVPNVVGDTQMAASMAITGAGLVVGTVTSQASTTVAAGDVISENPMADTPEAAGSSVNLVLSSGVPVFYSISATVSGLAGSGLVLQDNLGDNLSLSANGTFMFATAIAGGSTYGITVLTQPSSPAQTCVVGNGSGTATANATNVLIACASAPGTPIQYSVNLQIGTATVTGTITTDGTIGVLNSCLVNGTCGSNNIVNWNLALNDNSGVCGGQPCSINLVGPNGVTGADGYQIANNLGADLSATATQLLFNFSDTGPFAGAFFFETGNYGAVCFSPSSDCLASSFGAGQSLYIDPGFTLPSGTDYQSTSLSGIQVIGTSAVQVPNVAGDSQSVATSAITSAGLVVGTVTTASSTTVPAGEVISESPLAGTSVSVGSAVNLVLSSGPPQVAVPNVAGDTQSGATTAIDGAGLVVGTVTSQSSTTVSAGDVISENPAATTLVNVGSAVNLVLSSGPSQVAVPNVAGDTQNAATTAIDGAGLVVGTLTSQSSTTVSAGDVISENPTATTMVNVGSVVNLVLSSGPPVSVPNVVGYAQSVASSGITSAGLTLGTVNSQNSSTVPSGDVISETPLAGTLVGAGSAINLVVSSGPSGTTAVFIGSDTNTEGSWQTSAGKIYGTDGYVIEGASPTQSLPSYVTQYSTQGGSFYTWAASTTDPRALLNANDVGRVAGTVFGSSFTFDVTFTGGSHLFALYALDWDSTTRNETITIMDPNNGNQVLDTETVSNFHGGTYLVWNISGQVVVQVKLNSGSNAVISGVFFGIAETVNVMPQSPTLSAGQQQQFTATFTGTPSVSWSISNVSPMGAASGEINPTTGAYTAPGSITQTTTVTVQATSQDGTAEDSATVTLTASSAPVPVPNVVGDTQSVATNAITGVGLLVGTVTTAASNTVPSGDVINESPIAGTSVTAGSSVNLVLSTGPGQVMVPNVVNDTQAAATSAITGVELLVGTVTTATSGTVPSGDVISESPTAGTSVLAGSTVSLTVSTGNAIGGGTSAIFIGTDTNTQGNWQISAGKIYGTDGYVIEGASPTQSLPSYVTQYSTQGGSFYTWAASTTDPRALLNANDVGRVAGTVYGSMFTYNITFTQGSHLFALYALDWDSTTRNETITIMDPNNGNQVLDTETVSNFHGGTYLVWNISGQVVVQVKLNSGSNAVISGVFFGVAETVNVTPPSTTLSAGQQQQFAATFTGTPSVSWSISNVSPMGADAGEINPTTGAYTAPGSITQTTTVTVQATSQDGTAEGSATVTLTASSAPVPVPNVAGDTQAAATSAITGVGLMVGTVTTAASNTVPSGDVINESPIAGTSVAAGSSVNLVVSTGPGQVMVPSVVGDTQAAATSAITGAGLLVGTVTTATSGTVPSGDVISQNPTAGTSVSTGSAVNMVISTGSASTGPTVTFVKADTSTQGNWEGMYGTDGYDVINASTAISNALTPNPNVPSYATFSVSGGTPYTWASNPTDTRALEETTLGAAGARIAATWYSASSFSFSLNVSGTHQFALYAVDWEPDGRSETVTVVDPNNNNAVLDTEQLTGSNFEHGEYLVWNISGQVKIIVTLNSGSAGNAVVSGAFFGGASGAPTETVTVKPQQVTLAANQQQTFAATVVGGATLTVSWSILNGGPGGINPSSGVYTAPATFTNGTQVTIQAESADMSASGTATVTLSTTAGVSFIGTDSSTQGNWQGKYGNDGYDVVNAPSTISNPLVPNPKIPAYATFSVTDPNSPYTWTSTTSDPRALEGSATGSSGSRIAAAWFNNPSFSFDVNFTDGNPHQVEIYLLDWNSGGRVETIKIVDPSNNAVLDTETVSSFSGGVYYTWNISGHVGITVTVNNGANAVISGVFFN